MCVTNPLEVAMRIVVAVIVSVIVASAATPAQACGSVMWREHSRSNEERFIARMDAVKNVRTARGAKAALVLAEELLTDKQVRNVPTARVAELKAAAGDAALALGQTALAEKYLSEAVAVLPRFAAAYARAQIAAGYPAAARAQLEARAHKHALAPDAQAVLAQLRGVAIVPTRNAGQVVVATRDSARP